jgi:hypothetical protein
LIERGKGGGVVEGGGVDFEQVWDGRIEKCKRGAAVPAEGAVTVGELEEFGWCSFPDEAAGLEEGPDDEWRTTGAAAVSAVADGGLQWRSGEVIADGAAEAAAGERGRVHEGCRFMSGVIFFCKFGFLQQIGFSCLADSAQ